MIANAVVPLPQLRQLDYACYRIIPQVLDDPHPVVPFLCGEAAPKLPTLQPVGHPLVLGPDLVGPVEPGFLAVGPDLAAGLVRLLRRGILTVAGIVPVLQREPPPAVLTAPAQVPCGKPAQQIQRKGSDKCLGEVLLWLFLCSSIFCLTNRRSVIKYTTLSRCSSSLG